MAVRYRGRGGGQDEVVPWRLVGAVTGTTLTWEPSLPAGAPKSIGLGDVVEFDAAGPFVVKSQDDAHPFHLGAFMTGGNFGSGHSRGGPVAPVSVSQNAANSCHSLRQAARGRCGVTLEDVGSGRLF